MFACAHHSPLNCSHTSFANSCHYQSNAAFFLVSSVHSLNFRCGFIFNTRKSPQCKLTQILMGAMFGMIVRVMFYQSYRNAFLWYRLALFGPETNAAHYSILKNEIVTGIVVAFNAAWNARMYILLTNCTLFVDEFKLWSNLGAWGWLLWFS